MVETLSFLVFAHKQNYEPRGDFVYMPGVFGSVGGVFAC
jgi:hypothetical protein